MTRTDIIEIRLPRRAERRTPIITHCVESVTGELLATANSWGLAYRLAERFRARGVECHVRRAA
jgi:hypothetical protein